MNWEIEYQSKLCTAAQAVKEHIKDGDVVAMGGLSAAGTVLDAMFDQIKAGKLHGISLEGNLLTEHIPIDDPDLTPEQFRYRSFFYGGYERAGSKMGNVTFVPTQFHNYRRYMVTRVQPDVGVLHVSPPDENGNCNIGALGAGFNPAIVESAKVLIAQVNENIPYVYGTEMDVPVSRFSAFVKCDTLIPEYPIADSTEIDQIIANIILEYIPDGACIQLGIGGMSNAVGYGLKDKKELGVHTEMFTESLAYLHNIGVITNSRKTFMPGVSVAGFTLGSKSHYDYVHRNKLLHFAPYSFTNNVANIIQNDNMISINNAMMVDLTGQVCSESIGFRHFSGTGGQVDFVRGAAQAKNGKSFLTMSSTVKTREGIASRIVLNFPLGGVTTTLRSDVQYVVTEYGCVNLFGEDIPTRAKRLISIAHPDFRDELTFQAKKSGYIY